MHDVVDDYGLVVDGYGCEREIEGGRRKGGEMRGARDDVEMHWIVKGYSSRN
jgi:hypothetical protein